jgi:hypothetical protein
MWRGEEIWTCSTRLVVYYNKVERCFLASLVRPFDSAQDKLQPESRGERGWPPVFAEGGGEQGCRPSIYNRLRACSQRFQYWQ